MSDASQGPGWWQASDGKWYSPESRTGAAAPPPPQYTAPPPAKKGRGCLIGSLAGIGGLVVLGVIAIIVVIVIVVASGGDDTKRSWRVCAPQKTRPPCASLSPLARPTGPPASPGVHALFGPASALRLLNLAELAVLVEA